MGMITPALCALNIGLAAGLGWMWVDSTGQLRNVTWQAPAPLKPELGSAQASLAVEPSLDIARFASTLERPLFSPTRRPPPPPGVAPPPPPPDPLANLQLFGVYGNADSGGMLARVDGKMRRIAVNESFGGWTLKSINDRNVTLARGEESRTLTLALSKGPRPPVAAQAPGGAGGAATTAAVSKSVEERRQIQQQEERDRLRRRNELRATVGLPPLTE